MMALQNLAWRIRDHAQPYHQAEHILAGKGAAVKAQPAPVAQTHTQPLVGDFKAHSIQLPAVLPKSSLRTEDPLQSSLFTLSNVEQHAQVRQAIAVARELLSADTNEKKYALAEKLRRLLPMMIPERPPTRSRMPWSSSSRISSVSPLSSIFSG